MKLPRKFRSLQISAIQIKIKKKKISLCKSHASLNHKFQFIIIVTDLHLVENLESLDLFDF